MCLHSHTALTFDTACSLGLHTSLTKDRSAAARRAHKEGYALKMAVTIDACELLAGTSESLYCFAKHFQAAKCGQAVSCSSRCVEQAYLAPLQPAMEQRRRAGLP